MKTINIHGKEYAPVNERLKHFLENYKDHRIVTELVHHDPESCVVAATIYNGEDRVVATAHAQEDRSSTRINQTSYIENCETSAVGRALGFFGIGIDGGIASAEEVDMAIAKQAVEPQSEMHTLFGDNIAVIEGYFKSIGWLNDNQTIKDLPADKTAQALSRAPGLLKKALAWKAKYV